MPKALDMMLMGRNIKAAKAKKMGLVDLVVDPIGKIKKILIPSVEAEVMCGSS